MFKGELKTVRFNGLNVPESYLAAVLQMAAKKNQWSLNRVTFDTEVTEWQSSG